MVSAADAAGAAEAKAALRAQYRAARRALDPATRAEATAAVVRAVQALVAHLQVESLASYVAVGAELDLAAVHAWWWERGHPVYLPRTQPAQVLSWHAVGASTPLTPGPHGIPVPDPAQAPAAPLPARSLVLVPGLAFDADGYRLGQGGGFYDRTLAGGDVLPVGVGYPCQAAPRLPREPHDHPMRFLILGGEWWAVAGS